jgi:hypothetical protein
MTAEASKYVRLFGEFIHVPESTPPAETYHALPAEVIHCIVIECPTGKSVEMFLLHYDSAIATCTRFA